MQIAYKDLDSSKLSFYPFSIDTSLLGKFTARRLLNNLLHVSNDAPQKDWQRSEAIMKYTSLPFEVYPSRIEKPIIDQTITYKVKNILRQSVGLKPIKTLPVGYVDHKKVVEKYKEFDGFVHIAKDIKDKVHIDGKYTASFIEAGATGAILFWHDTFGLGNDLKTVFSLPLDEKKAAEEILRIRETIDIVKHSKETRREMLNTFNPKTSVAIRARKIKELL